MSLFVTLFGGMILTAVLYGIGRLGRLSNFWAAVAGCAVPSFAYLLYGVARWPGLDVVTLHLVAYPTIAVLLYQLYGEKANHGNNLHWAPKLMVVFFLLISVLYGGFVYVAGQGLPPALARILLPNVADKNIHTGFAGVVEHDAGAAKGIGQQLKVEHALASLGWKVEVRGLGQLPYGQAREVVVYIRDAAGAGVDGRNVSLALGRPGQKPGAPVALTGSGAAGYRGMLAAPAVGTWVAYLGISSGQGMLVMEHTVEVR